MRLLTVAVLAALFLAAPGVVRAQEAPPTICVTTEEDFISSAVNNYKAKVLVAGETARDKILAKINDARVEAKLWPFEADKLAVGLIMKDGQMFVGIVMFKDRCVVPGTVKIVRAEYWVAFITDLGISMDEFTPERDA
jgi:hypothetical protein